MTDAKVLIVEDEYIIAQDIKMILMEMGFNVLDIITSGEEAVNRAEEMNPDIILMDIKLKGKIDGISAAEKIKGSINIPFIYLTSYSDDNSLKRAKITEPYGYILKPINNQELYFTITMALYRHEMQVELQRREEQYRTVVQNTSDLIIRYDDRCRFLFVNNMGLAFLGLPVYNYKGKNHSDTGFPEDARAFLEDRIRRTFLFKEHDLFELNVNINGKEFFLETALNPEFSSDGNVASVLSISRDLTERRETESVMRLQSEIIENMTDGVNLVSINDGTILYTNPKFDEMFGYMPGDIIGKHFSVLYPRKKKDFPGKEEEILNTVKEKGQWQGEITNTRKDGNISWFFVNVSEFNHNKFGRVLLSVYTDITGRKQAEDALHASQEMLKLTSRKGRIGHWKMNLETNRVWWSDEIYDLFERDFSMGPLESIDGMPFLDPEDKKQLAEAMRQAVETGKSFNADFRISLPSGRSVYHTCTINPVKDASGALKELWGTVQDITERKKDELEIKRLSREIMQSQERERQRVAKDLHDGVGQTILAARLNFDTYMNDPEKPLDRFRRGMDFLDKASTELREVYFALFPSILKDLGLVSAVTWFAKNSLEARGIIVNLKADDYIDQDRDIEVPLYRIIQEVFSNIIKHSGADSVWVELLVDGKNSVILSIQDNGAGFDLLEIKERGGLGISNIRQRVANLGGILEIETAHGKGTELLIVLPGEKGNGKNKDISCR